MGYSRNLRSSLLLKQILALVVTGRVPLVSLLERLLVLLVCDPELEEDLSLHFQLFDARFQFLEAGPVILLNLLVLQVLDESLRDINFRFGRIVVVGENSVFGVALVLVAPVVQRTILVSTSKLEASEALVVADLSNGLFHL